MQVEEYLVAGYRAVLANMRRPKRKRSQSQTPLRLRPPRVEEPDVASASAAEGEGEAAVLSLDVDSFYETVAKHPFVVAQFYAPWCLQSKKLGPEYDKAARLLSKHDPPIVVVKVDGNDDKNWALATRYNIEGFPTLEIFRNYGNNIQEYKGPREAAEGIVEYLKKQVGPASKEIKSPEDAAAVLITNDKTICIVGVFTEFSGTEFSNFMEVAEKLRSDYDFAHTLHANYLPRGDVMVERPFVRLLKPFDELVTDCKEFDIAALEKFIDTSSTPRVVTLDRSRDNHSFLLKFYESSAPKAMLFLNFSAGTFDSFKSTYYAAAVYFKDKEIKFLIGDIKASQGALNYFGLKKDQAPLILIRHRDSSMFLKDHIEADQIVSWLKEYFDGKLTPFKKSQPITEVNNEPVKVVVADSLHDVVFKSGKNVLIELYAPWCRDCKKLAPILEEAATTLQSDDEVVVAKMDATANDVPSEFDGCQGYPSMYLVTASGKVTAYDGGRTANEIVDFVKKNKGTARATTVIPETAADNSATAES